MVHRVVQRKSRPAALGFAAIIAISSGCGPTSEQAGASRELVVGVDNDFTTLDPIKAQEPYTLRVIGQIFEGLVAIDESGALEPVLAEDFSHNETFDSWTFQIRRGVHFHDDAVFEDGLGREVTAEDVAFSFQRLVSPESYPAFVLADIIQGASEFRAGDAATVGGIRVLGPGRIEFRLTRPDPRFLHRITSPWFVVMPKEAVQLGFDVFGRTKAIGTGPFRLVSRTDTEALLARNERYWRKVEGNVRQLTFRVIRNEQLRLSELRNGRLGIVSLTPSLIPALVDLAKSARDGSKIELKPGFADEFDALSYPTFNSHFVGFNCDKLDVHLRRAISLGIDRREIVSAVARGAATLATGTVPHEMMGYIAPHADDIYDPDRAARELRLSSYRPGNDQIELLVHEKDDSDLLGQLLQSQLARLGLDIRLRQLDYNTVVQRMIKGDTEAFVLALEYVFSSPEPILYNLFHSSKIPVPNFWHYANPQVDAALDGLRYIEDRTESNLSLQDIERQVIDDAPAAFLYQSRHSVIFRKGITGIAYNGHSTPLLWRVRLTDNEDGALRRPH